MFNNVPPNGFPQIPDIEDLEAVVQDVTALKSSKANKAGIAPAFSAEGNYSVGDLVYYEGTLYKCTTAHEAAAWDAEDFTETTIAAETADIQGDVSDLESTKANQITIAPTFSAETEYSAGDIVYYNGLSYRCTNDHEGAWDADDFTPTTVALELASLKSGLTNLISDMPVKVVKESIPERGSIEIQLAANKVYQYYTWRDSEGYVYMGLIDTAYTGLITNHPIVKPQVDVISFTDGGNLALSVANSSDYAAFILLYEVSK